MAGQASTSRFIPPGTTGPHSIYLTRFEMELYDDDTGSTMPDFICHGHIAEDGPAGYARSRFLGLHAGGQKLQMPDGFALMLNVSPEAPLQLYGMAADYSGKRRGAEVHYEMELEYFAETQARQRNLEPLNFRFVALSLDSETYHDVARAHEKHADRGNYHWMVPPGRHEYRSILNHQLFEVHESDLRVHHIHNHVHPYAEYVEIFSRTTGESVYRADASTHPERGVLQSVDHYMDVEGFMLRKGHIYDMVVVYDNTTGAPIDAMYTARISFQAVAPLMSSAEGE